MTTTTYTRRSRPWLPALNLVFAAVAIVLASIALVTATNDDDDAATRSATVPTARVAPANAALEDWEKVPPGPVRDAMREDAVVWEPLIVEGRDFVREVPTSRAAVDDESRICDVHGGIHQC